MYCYIYFAVVYLLLYCIEYVYCFLVGTLYRFFYIYIEDMYYAEDMYCIA